MITCNLCGNGNPAGTVNCQRCGTLLASNSNNSVNPTMAVQEQPALPAWLESLRSDMTEKSEKPLAPENNRSNFNASNMVDNGPFASWTQPERGQAQGNVPTNMQEGLRTSSYPAPNTDESFFAERGIAASSLIDQQALPPWMQQENNASSQVPQRNIPASSLIQADAMPSWMKSMQPSQPQAPFVAGPPQAQQMPQMPPPVTTPPPGQNFAAHNLIDQQSLPSWMMQQHPQNPQQPEHVQQQYPVQAVGQQQSGQDGMFSASSLLDENSLPSWMRENAQGQWPTNAPTAPALQPQQNASWQAAQSMQSPQAQQNMAWQSQAAQPQGNVQGSNTAMNSNGMLSASSFIDVNALPSWLRPAEGNYNAPPVQGGMVNDGQSGQQRQGPYAGPPRVDNVRVPSRPRGEAGANEGSEVAANVFASMLGVASTAPNFPPQGQGSGQAPLPGAYGQPNGQQQPQGMPPMGMQGPPQGSAMAQQMQNNPGGIPQPGYMQGPYSNNYTVQGNYPGNPSLQQPPNMAGQQGTMNGFNMAQGNMGMNGEQRTNAKPAKRGLFEAIRNLFFRS